MLVEEKANRKSVEKGEKRWARREILNTWIVAERSK